MIRFFVYENLKHWIQGDDYGKDIGTIKTALCGATAGAASVFGNTPIDVIKTRLQVHTLPPCRESCNVCILFLCRDLMLTSIKVLWTVL